MSSIIAVAGGTGGLGRAIVDALKANSDCTVFVLSREVSEQKEKEIGAHFIAVDYNDPAGIAEALEKNNVDTVISALTSGTGSGLDMILIDAAERSSATKRLIPSIWGVPYDSRSFAIFPPGQAKTEIVSHLATTSLEYTAFYTGLFLDYYVPRVPTYMKPFAIVLDAENNAAGVPGSGNVPVTFTHSWDTAKFVAAYVGKPKWDKEVYVIGDKSTWNGLIQAEEKAKGVTFKVSHDSVQDLEAGKVTELPSHPHIYPFFPKHALQGFLAGMGWIMEHGYLDLKPKHTLNQEFNSIKARGIKELLAQCWKN